MTYSDIHPRSENENSMTFSSLPPSQNRPQPSSRSFRFGRLAAVGIVLAALFGSFNGSPVSADAPTCSDILNVWTPTDDVYSVTTIDQIYCLGTSEDSTLLSQSFLQVGDLSWSARLVEENGSLPTEWSVIGSGGVPFTGIYNGGGHSVSGIVWNAPSTGGEIGFFGSAKNALIKNVSLLNITIGSSYSTGALAAILDEGTVVDNVHVNGVVSSAQDAGDGTPWYETGGFAGRAVGTSVNRVTIKNSSFEGTVSAVGVRVGGLVGYGANVDIINVAVGSDAQVTSVSISKGTSSANNPDSIGAHSFGGGIVGVLEDSTVDLSKFNGVVSGKSLIGGIAGRIVSGSIRRSTVAGTIKGRAMTGGLAGWAEGTQISDVASSATIMNSDQSIVGNNSNANFVGGIVGLLDSNGSVKHAINTGNVAGYSYVGGIVGSLVLVFSVADPLGYGSTNGFGNIDEAYSLGTVAKTYGSGIWGGIVGQMSWQDDFGQVKRSFSLDTASTYSIDRGPSGARAANPLTTDSNLKLFSTYSPTFNVVGTSGQEVTIVDGWAETVDGFGPYWGMCSTYNNGYPFLLKLTPVKPNECSEVTVSPEAPYDLAANVTGPGTAELSFMSGTTYGQSTITNYEYSVDGGTNWMTCSPATTVSPILMTGLLNGQTNMVKLRAISAASDLASLGIEVTLNATDPAEPTQLNATVSDQSLSIAFAPGVPNGPSISNYQYTLDDGQNWFEFDPPQLTSPVVINGLTNGAQYRVRLRAVNSVYAGGGLSSQTLDVTMHDVPDAPTNLAVVPGNGSLQVSFTPGSDHGAEILNYEYSVNDGDDWTAVSPSVQPSPITISGLTNGTTYQVKLRAINEIGTGESSVSVSGQPVAPTVPTTEPEGTTPSTTNPNDSTTTTLPTNVPAPREQVVLDLPAAATPLIADTSLSLGAPVVMEFGGFVPGEFVQLIVASTPRVIGSGYADSEGKIRLTGTLPSDLSFGEHSLALYAPESGRGIRQPITVAQSLLPATGTSPLDEITVVILFVVVGLYLLMVSRNRRMPKRMQVP